MSNRTYATGLGTQLRERRKLLRLNQTEVADLAGTTQRTVSQVEAGKAANIGLYLDIAHVLGMQARFEPYERPPSARPGAKSTP
ncbi:MAG: helix-turn-helix domain-containing protein [Nitriliruptor sp.]